jgi:hypothetical protein
LSGDTDKQKGHSTSLKQFMAEGLSLFLPIVPLLGDWQKNKILWTLRLVREF